MDHFLTVKNKIVDDEEPYLKIQEFDTANIRNTTVSIFFCVILSDSLSRNVVDLHVNIQRLYNTPVPKLNGPNDFSRLLRNRAIIISFMRLSYTFDFQTGKNRRTSVIARRYVGKKRKFRIRANFGARDSKVRRFKKIRSKENL